MVKKTLTLIALCALCTTALTACSNSNTENSSTSNTENSVSESTATEISESSTANTTDETSDVLGQYGITIENDGSYIIEISENSEEISYEFPSEESDVVVGENCMTIYVNEVSNGSMKGESIPSEEDISEEPIVITVYNVNITPENISESMVVTITYTGELNHSGNEYTVNADSFEAL